MYSFRKVKKILLFKKTVFCSDVIWSVQLKYILKFAYSLPETQPFVDELFEAILNKSYMPQTELPSSVAKMEKDEQKKDEVTFGYDGQMSS